MAIRATESGKAFRYATGFDMSANTALELHFTNPSGVVTNVTNPRVTAPGVAIIDPDIGPINASEYMEFIIESTDFPISGAWVVCGIFTNTNTTPDQIYHGSKVSFDVGEAC